MALTTTPHLNFNGQAREALGFYQSVFGGDLHVATYADFGMPAELDGADRVVFGSVASADGFRIMAYDVPADAAGVAPAGTTTRVNGTTHTTERTFVSVSGESADEVAARWEQLKDGAAVIEEFAPAPWTAGFGMLTDRFGVTWVLDVAA